MKQLLVLLTAIMLFTSCQHSQKKYKVQEFTQTKDDNTILYWYILTNDKGYYYYSSPTPVTSFSDVQWTVSTTNPVAGPDFTPTPNEISVTDSDLAQAGVESNGFETSSETEGTESSGFEGADNDAGGSENSSDAGSSDSGGGDSGGGDGGGGDGGGGGGE